MGIHSVFSVTLFKHVSTGVDGCPGEMMQFRKSLSEVHNPWWCTAQASVKCGTWGGGSLSPLLLLLPPNEKVAVFGFLFLP